METQPRAVAAGAPKQRLTFTYDYQGRRISKKVEDGKTTNYQERFTMLFLYDGWNLVAKVLATGPKIRTYGWGNDLSGGKAAGGVGGLLFINQYPEEKTYTVGYDGNGNVVGLFDIEDGGSIRAYYEYDLFGDLLRTSGPLAQVNPFKWYTKYWDNDTGLVFYGGNGYNGKPGRGRYYSPILGRWLSQEPLGDIAFFQQYIQGKNREKTYKLYEESLRPVYVFVRNDPISFIDPFGLERISFDFETEIKYGKLFPLIPSGVKSVHYFIVDTITLEIVGEIKRAGPTFGVTGGFIATRNIARDDKNPCAIRLDLFQRLAWLSGNRGY